MEAIEDGILLDFWPVHIDLTVGDSVDRENVCSIELLYAFNSQFHTCRDDVGRKVLERISTKLKIMP